LIPIRCIVVLFAKQWPVCQTLVARMPASLSASLSASRPAFPAQLLQRRARRRHRATARDNCLCTPRRSSVAVGRGGRGWGEKRGGTGWEGVFARERSKRFMIIIRVGRPRCFFLLSQPYNSCFSQPHNSTVSFSFLPLLLLFPTRHNHCLLLDSTRGKGRSKRFMIVIPDG
jgi:hypothetical protein